MRAKTLQSLLPLLLWLLLQLLLVRATGIK